jgi:Rps23 Pro-64 3,4-dihydroxylase Tpa1-like proline 4-hydroxylase
MTTREMLDSLSSTLVCDERILSVPERELLANLLQRTAIRTSGSTDEVAKAITRTVGEIVAERALGVLGESITQRLLQQLVSSSGFPDRGAGVIYTGGTPSTPPPSPSPDGSQPRPPGTSPPGRSIAAASTRAKTGGVAVLEAADSWPAEYTVLDEFLAPADLDALIRHTLDRETQFQVSEVLSPGVSGGAVDFEQRRSNVLMDLGTQERVIVERLKTFLPRALHKLGRDPFPIAHVECQITASKHGDFFLSHTDNGAPEVASREITFVYFFHREPKKFSGGELRIYDSLWENDHYVPTANYRTIVPEQNQLILFPSALAHEITRVDCPSGTFADSRFTVNGWLHK